MKWTKLGNIFQPDSSHPKLISHASNPLAIHLRGAIYRVFYSGRDNKNRSSIGYFDLDMKELTVVARCEQPVLTHGDPKSFYSHGVSIGNAYEDTDGLHILFMGWQIRGNDHWRGDIGKINVSKCLNELTVDSASPFMTVDDVDEVSLSYPWVYKDQCGIYHMWYGSTHTWSAENGEMVHVINHASSEDAMQWEKTGLAIPYELNVAQAFSRPAFWSDPEGEHMVFSYRSGRGEKYRIGYANRPSSDFEWRLNLDEVGINVGDNGEWDSEMICYPYVFEYCSSRYMLYNGNSHGKTGIGIAVLEVDHASK